MTCGLFVLAVASGMLGLGVASSAVPFLALYERQRCKSLPFSFSADSCPEVLLR
jgi:hypothetical protein